MSTKNKVKIDEFSKHEVVDRASNILNIMAAMLEDHPAMTPELMKLFKKSHKAMFDLYQAAACLNTSELKSSKIKTKKTTLIPPDFVRCQSTKGEGSFMTLGGGYREVRCDKEPDCIAEELTPGNDGLMGSMSLCLTCLEEFKTKHDSSKYQFTYI